MMDIQDGRTGALIRQARAEHGMTQKQLADRLHISDRTVSKWERGAGFPDLSLLEPLAGALELTVTELLHGRREDIQTAPQAITVQDAVSVLNKAWKKKMGELRRTVLTVCAALVLTGAVIFVLTIPSEPGGFSGREDISITQIFPGGNETTFSFRLDNRGTPVSPDEERFETKFSPTELTAHILAQPDVDPDVAVWTIDGEEFRLFTVYPPDGLKRYALLWCHPKEGRRWLYNFGAMQTWAYLKEDAESRRILFPAFLLKRDGSPAYLHAEEPLPTLFPAAELRKAFDALRDYYEGAGAAEWYHVETNEADLSVTLTAADALREAKLTGDVQLCFRIAVFAQDGMVFFRLNTV